MNTPFDPSEPRILDGGLATELERRGCSLDDPLWSARALLDQPELIEQVHFDYLSAGAQCITSASYQASLEGFRKRGLSDEQAENLIRKSVAVALRARSRFLTNSPVDDPTPLVAASIGPYGAILHDGSEFRGDYGLSLTDLTKFHERRTAILAGSGADLLACETIPTLLEAKALAQVLRGLSGAKAWISFSCNDQQRTCAGDSIADCAAFLDDVPSVFAVGVNCTAPGLIESLIGQIRRSTAKPIVVYPNSGETWNYQGKCWQGSGDVEEFCRLAQRWRDAGATWIGGCCRTTPEHVRRLSRTLD